MRAAATILLTAVALAAPARADDAPIYRQIRFGNALAAGHLSACSIDFRIDFPDPIAPPRRTAEVAGTITFSRRDGRLSAAMTMWASGDYTTKFTGIGRIADVTLSRDGEVLRLEPWTDGDDPTHDVVPPERISDLSTMLDGPSTLSFTLSKPVRPFALPFSLTNEGLGANDPLVAAGRAIFDDCMTSLVRAPGEGAP